MNLYRLDLRGEICPFTLVRTKKELNKISSGERLLIIVDYPTSVDEISTWAKERGHAVLEIKKGEGLLWEMLIEKKGNDNL